jgi:uncharacterized membrane protein YgcG
MRKGFIGIITIFLLVSAMPVWADMVDDGLPPTVSERVRNQAREMIRAGVPADDAVAMTRSMVQNQYREEHTLQAQRQVIAACDEGLPPEPIMNKLQEGLAKKVPPEKVVKAMQTVRERHAHAYRHARQVTEDPAAQKVLGDALAQGLAAGMKPRDMARVQERVRERVRLQACDDCPQLALESALTARDMARLGVDSDTAGDVVCQALERGYGSPEMHRMRHRFRNRVHDDDPQRLAYRYAHAFRNGQDPADDTSTTDRSGSGQQSREGNRDGSGGGSGGNGGSDGGGDSGGSGDSGGGGSGGGNGGSGGGGDGGGGGGGGRK